MSELGPRDAACADEAARLVAAARRCIGRGRLLAAETLLHAACEAGGDKAEIEAASADLLLRAGRPSDAAARFAAAIALDVHPHRQAEWRAARAAALLQAGDPTGAAREAAEALAGAPRDLCRARPPATLIATLGAALLALGQADDAASCLADAVAAAPGHVGHCLMLARAQCAIGDGVAATATLHAGIEAAPRAAALRVAAMRLALAAGDATSAADMAQSARDAGIVDGVLFSLRGHALMQLGRDDEAGDAFADALCVAPEDPCVRHMAAAAGRIAYVAHTDADTLRAVFDGMAPHTEADLLRRGYRVPGLLHAAVAASRPKPVGPVLDVGCGTGFAGLVLSDPALDLGPITGIDLSPAMLAQAGQKGVYATLIEGDACTRPTPPHHFGLVVAADVLPFAGAPEALFAAAAMALRPDGLCLVSAETFPGDGPPRLGPRARWRHAVPWLCRAARSSGLTVAAVSPEVQRYDDDSPVPGVLLTLRPDPDVQGAVASARAFARS